MLRRSSAQEWDRTFLESYTAEFSIIEDIIDDLGNPRI